MSPLLRGSLVAVSLSGAFAAGYFVKPRLDRADAGQTTPAAVVPAAPKGVPVSAWSKGGSPVVAQQPLAPAKQALVASELPPITPPPAPSAASTIDLTDPGLQMVKNSLNIKTTIIDKPEPPLPVLPAPQ